MAYSRRKTSSRRGSTGTRKRSTATRQRSDRTASRAGRRKSPVRRAASRPAEIRLVIVQDTGGNGVNMSPAALAVNSSGAVGTKPKKAKF